MVFDNVSHSIIAASLRVHSALGPGLLEGAYQACLEYELRRRGHFVQGQWPLPIEYRGIEIDVGYRVDLLVDESVIVEIKAVSKILPVHHAQLLSYMRLSSVGIGLLLNFHELRLKNGIKRIVL